MLSHMDSPCKAVVWYLLPAVGAELSRELSAKGMPQKEIAARLSITPSAVSQYLKEKRGMEVRLGEKSAREIRRLAEDIFSGKAGKPEVTAAVCGICHTARAERVLCGAHQRDTGDLKCGFCCTGKAK